MACPHEKPPGWTRCLRCSAEFMRSWRRVTISRDVRMARKEGAEMMRSAIIQHFMRFDRVMFQGGAVAAITRNIEMD